MGMPAVHVANDDGSKSKQTADCKRAKHAAGCRKSSALPGSGQCYCCVLGVRCLLPVAWVLPLQASPSHACDECGAVGCGRE
jgi:hypothetical protein